MKIQQLVNKALRASVKGHNMYTRVQLQLARLESSVEETGHDCHIQSRRSIYGMHVSSTRSRLACRGSDYVRSDLLGSSGTKVPEHVLPCSLPVCAEFFFCSLFDYDNDQTKISSLAANVLY